MKTKESIGAVIRRLRTEKSWTQEVLAEKLHLTPQAVSRWETELSLPDVSQVPLLARVLGVTTDTLFGVEAEPEEDEELLLNADMVYLASDPASALEHWEKMAERLRAGDLGRMPSNFRWTFLGLSVHLADPESPAYSPERAAEVRAEALALGTDLPRQEGDRFLQSELRRDLARLYALDGQQEAAFPLLGDADFLTLSQFRPAAQGELWRLLGKRREEGRNLKEAGTQAFLFLLDTLYDAGDNALALGEAERALEAAETALRLIPLLCRREKQLPALHVRPRGDLYGLLARARAALGDREGALGALEEMLDRRLAPDAQNVDTGLLAVFAPATPDAFPQLRRNLRARLRQELGKPELKQLLDGPEGDALRKRAETIAAD